MLGHLLAAMRNRVKSAKSGPSAKAESKVLGDGGCGRVGKGGQKLYIVQQWEMTLGATMT